MEYTLFNLYSVVFYFLLNIIFKLSPPAHKVPSCSLPLHYQSQTSPHDYVNVLNIPLYAVTKWKYHMNLPSHYNSYSSIAQ